MRLLIYGIFVSTIVLSTACNSNTRPQNENNDTMEDYVDTEHTSQSSLDWHGQYEGVLPCADCPGIKTTVILSDSSNFTYKAEYLERDLNATDSGSFTWHNNGSVVHLMGQDVDLKFQVGENRLFHLDQEGNRITGALADNYTLHKTP